MGAGPGAGPPASGGPAGRGRGLARRSVATAAIDLSDSLVADLAHLGRGLRVEVDLDADAGGRKAPAADEALSGGEVTAELLVATPVPRTSLVAAFAGRRPGPSLPVGVGAPTEVGRLDAEGWPDLAAGRVAPPLLRNPSAAARGDESVKPGLGGRMAGRGSNSQDRGQGDDHR